jgi:hypothetical protein
MLGRVRRCGLAAGFAALPLYGCGSSTPKLNTVAIERAIEGSILAERSVHATVVCPSKVVRKAGLTFVCTAKLEVGTYPLTVTETDASGHVRYENNSRLIILNITNVEKAIAQSILSQRHLPATVTCPAEVIQQSGIRFTCTATLSGRRYPFAVTEVDSNGHVTYLGGP